jgi:hypothetical protein
VTTDDNTNPTPETLAAYLDGELTPSERNTMERRLSSRPDLCDELDAHRRLSRVWQTTHPSEPDDQAWGATMAGISNRLPVLAAKHPRRRFPLGWFAGIAAAAAVIALIWILAGKPRLPDPTSPQPEIETVETFPAASPDDVDITSLWGAGDELVLVGRPPLDAPMELAGPGDVVIDEKSPVKDTNIEFHEEPGSSPMIIIQPEKAKVN